MIAGRRNSTALIFVVVTLGSATAARGIYINPDATIPNATQPAVGKVGKFGGAFDCTGSILQNQISAGAPTGFVLSAGHCSFPFGGAAYTDLEGKFQINGGGATVFSDAIRRYPTWIQNGGLNNGDVSLFRFDNAPAAFTSVTALDLLRTSTVNQNDTPTFVGFGAGNGTGYGMKRQTTFTMNAPGGNGLTTFNTPAGGPHTCGGDSGGPYLKSGAIGAIHTGAIPNQCAGGATLGTANLLDHTAAATDPLVPKKVNWLDSYTQKAIFWDELELTAPGGNVTSDSFDFPVGSANYGATTLATGWSLANDGSVEHPSVGVVGESDGWRYISSIGRANDGTTPELYTDGTSGQGEIMLSGGASLIKKDFDVFGGQDVTLTVEQRWNSLGLLDDVGVRLPDGSFVWDGLTASAVDNLDQWFTRDLSLDLTGFPGPQTITVYLLNVPEPASLGVVALMGAALLVRRRAAARRGPSAPLRRRG